MDYETHRALSFQFFLSAESVDAARRSSKWRERETELEYEAESC